MIVLNLKTLGKVGLLKNPILKLQFGSLNFSKLKDLLGVGLLAILLVSPFAILQKLNGVQGNSLHPGFPPLPYFEEHSAEGHHVKFEPINSQVFVKSILWSLLRIANQSKPIGHSISSIWQKKYQTLEQQFEEVRSAKERLESQIKLHANYFRTRTQRPKSSLAAIADRSASYSVRAGLGDYHLALDVIEEADLNQITRQWERMKDKIAAEIGIIEPSRTLLSNLRSNTATTIDELHSDAHAASQRFKEFVYQVIFLAGVGHFECGPGEKHLLKTKENIESKIVRSEKTWNFTPAQSLSYMMDALRGTIFVSDVSELFQIIEVVKKEASKRGWDFAFTNYWLERRPLGYVGVHVKLRIPISEAEGGPYKAVLAELQLHLMPWSKIDFLAFKERQHEIFVLLREEDFTSALTKKGEGLSMLLFITLFEEILNNKKSLNER